MFAVLNGNRIVYVTDSRRQAHLVAHQIASRWTQRPVVIETSTGLPC